MGVTNSHKAKPKEKKKEEKKKLGKFVSDDRGKVITVTKENFISTSDGIAADIQWVNKYCFFYKDMAKSGTFYFIYDKSKKCYISPFYHNNSSHFTYKKQEK